MASRATQSLLVPCSALLVLTGCDNVGRAFDRSKGGSNPTATTIQAMVAEGVSVAGRPKVKNVFPKGNGWPGTVPVVVEFNETINESTVSPSGGGTPNLFVRRKGSSTPDPGGIGLPPGGGTSSTPIAASYDFLMGGRGVVIRPATAFDPNEALTYEVVITPELRDADGIRFGGSSEKVIATFTPDKDDSIVDGEILTMLPVDFAKDQMRETSVYAIFTKPATQATVKTGSAGNFNLQLAGGTNIDGDVSFPINSVGFGASGKDGRILEFKPKSILAPTTEFRTVVKETILFGTGKLEFKGRTPFARFTTLAPAPVVTVKVGNASAGAPDKVNLSNIANLRIDVDLPAESIAGDNVEVRIYGLHKDGGNTGSQDFVASSAVAPVSGLQTVAVDFAGSLGTSVLPKFLEGDLTIVARLLRGSKATGYVLADSNNNPALDVTAPTLTTPKADALGNRFVYTDQEYVVFYGTGSEDLGAATLVLDSTPGPAPVPTTGVAFGFGAGGKFMFDPIQLGRRTTPIGFSLTITDAAGNESAPIAGSTAKIVQRGVVTTGSVPAGTLIVEAYDDATFLPVAGATVLIEPGMPTKPATGRQTKVTGSDGRVEFTGLGAAGYTVTLVKSGYHLFTLLNTPARFTSLPMRPTTNATATISGLLGFAATPGQSAMIGCNIIDDIRTEELRSTTTAPTALPKSVVRPNRPYIVTAYSGAFEPTAVSTYTNWACSICGPTGIVKQAAQAPIEPTENGNVNLVLLPTTGATRDLDATYDKDLATWTGLDTANLDGTPTVRVMTSLFGFSGMTLTGVGFAKQVGTSTTYTVNASYSLAESLVMATLLPKFWVSLEATDKSGNIARHRRIVANTTLGTTLASTALPGIPTITAPGGASTGSPSVTFQDRLDAASIPSGFAFQVLTATDSAGRQWRVVQQDTDALTGDKTVQFPDFAGVTETGLATGSWTMLAEGHLVFSLTFGAGDYLLEEMRREEITYTRAATRSFTVN